MISRNNNEEQNDKTLPGWRKPHDTLRGYSGDNRKPPVEDHVLESVHRRRVIQGYSGFIPDGKSVTGRPIIPSDEHQRRNNDISIGVFTPDRNATFQNEDSAGGFHNTFGERIKRMDLLERYADATRALFAREQSPEILIKLVQAKISERVQSYAQQLKTVKLEFMQYKVDPKDGFNEAALREVLERMNIQLDDVQSLALFAFFDVDGVG